ncbi:unnamed protein product [Orchesella dallaii]|uniref:HRDC domain-containing protein n=1 Tax=Orchesella dallaii TaxID=48710 RepID=A0ABP1R805_9HEXA
MSQIRAKINEARLKWGIQTTRPHTSIPGFLSWRREINQAKSLPTLHPYKYTIENWHISADMVSVTDLVYPRFTRYIRTEAELADCSIDLHDNAEITVDTEMNSDSYHHVICIIQISTKTADYVIDSLKLFNKIRQYLAPSFENPEKLKIFHSSNDLLHLQRNFGIFMVAFIDTQEVFEILHGTKQIAFDKMAKSLLDKDVNKLPQLADWRLSPLPDDLLEYAAADTRLLFECWLKLKHDAVSIESEEFPVSRKNSLKLVSSYNTQTAEAAWSRYTTANTLSTTIHKKQFISLFNWRDGKGKEHDIHPNKIITPHDLESIIIHNPTTTNSLRDRIRPCRDLHNSYYLQIIDILAEYNPNPDSNRGAISMSGEQSNRKVILPSLTNGNLQVELRVNESWEPMTWESDGGLQDQLEPNSTCKTKPPPPNKSQSRYAKRHRRYRANVRARQSASHLGLETEDHKRVSLNKCVSFARQLNLTKTELLSYLNELPDNWDK